MSSAEKKGRPALSSDAGATIGESTAIPLWICLVVVLGAVLLAAGAVIALVNPAMLASPHDQVNGAVRIYAGYLTARNGALALLLLALLAFRARRALGNLMALVGFIQLLDAGLDCTEARWAIVPGILVFGVIFLLGAARLSGGLPFWKREAWVP
jgi:hypothetical protein